MGTFVYMYSLYLVCSMVLPIEEGCVFAYFWSPFKISVVI